MPATWEGSYLDGRTPGRQPVSVVLSPQGLILTGGAVGSRLWPYASVRLTQGQYAGEQVRFERGDGPEAEILLVRDPAVLERLHRLAPQLVGRFSGPKRERTRIGLAVIGAVGAVALVAGLYLWGIPAVSYVVAPWVPPAWEARLGDSVLAHLAPRSRRCMSEPVDQAMRALVARLLAGAPDVSSPVRVIVVRDPRVNAFAIPGGKIVLLSGLLEGTGSPEEQAAVLAHELQHIVRRHATRALLEQASAGLVLTALTGDATGVLAFGLEGARTLAVLRYSRRNEEEADAEGLRMLVAAGIDPRGMLTFLERLQAAEGKGRAALPAYLSTHPDTGSRIARLRGKIGGQAFSPLVLPDVDDWKTIAQGCRAPVPGHDGRAISH